MSSNTSNSAASASSVSKGRRRRRLDDEGEDGVEKTDPNAAGRPSECESEGEGPDIGSELSEYESAVESADQEEETEEGSETETETGSETESGSDTETEGGDGYSDEEGLDQERQSGDGEEQPDNEKPDDDEDKKNPAYVPRRGAFYEHDFRQGDEGQEGEEAEPAKEPAKPVKKLWQEEGKWAHDRYIDDLQAPKSTEELIAIYGYDIRAADKPPDAPLKKPGSGGRGGRRERSFQDFVPRMAVIDTTEDGVDSVPNLGGENFIPYNNSSRRGGGRDGPDRGGRGGHRGRGRGGYNRNTDVEQNNYRNRQEGSGRYNEAPSQDSRYQGTTDFPSLQESTQPRDRRGEQRSKGYERLRQDTQFGDDRGDWRQSGQVESRGGGGNNRRGGYGDARGGRGSYSNSQDVRRGGNENWRSSQQNYDNDRGNSRRGGYRHQDSGRGSRDDNWRSANDPRGNFDRGDFKRDPRDNTGFANNNKGQRMGNSGDYRSDRQDNYRESRGYEQPPRYQQAKQEFTNTSMRVAEDRSGPLPQRGLMEGKKPENSMALSANSPDSSDISKNVVVSSSHEKGQREKVQTINVTITSTTTEKKSYAKERRAKGAMSEGNVLGAATGLKQIGPPMAQHHQQSQYQQQHPRSGNPNAGPGAPVVSAPGQQAQGKRYSSQRQQAIASRPFTEPPPPAAADTGGSKLYNPAMPPPPFFPRDQNPAAAAAKSVPPPNVQQPPLPPSVGVPDPSHFTQTMLPPVTVPLQYPLPVSNASLTLPPSAAAAGGVGVNPAIFQQAAHPPPAQGTLPAAPPPGAPMIAPPFLPAGVIYSGSPRVPPPHNAAQAPPFPMPIAYTSPPPQAPVTPQTQPGVPQQTAPATSQPQHKVYRGDITYYAPELQQPPRVQQKRPKAAIPIIDPQVIREQKRQARQAAQLEKAPQDGAAAAVPQATQGQGKQPDTIQDRKPAEHSHLAPAQEVPYVPASLDNPKPSQQPALKQEVDIKDSCEVKPVHIKEDVKPVDVKEEVKPVNVKKELCVGTQKSFSSTKDISVPLTTLAGDSLDIKQEFISEVVAAKPANLSDPVVEKSNVSIVTVDSRPPLTIVQSFNDPIVALEKDVSALDLKKENSPPAVAVETSAECETKDGQQPASEASVSS